MEKTYDGELLTDGRFPVRAKHRFTYLDFLAGALCTVRYGAYGATTMHWRSSAEARFLSLAQMRF